MKSASKDEDKLGELNLGEGFDTESENRVLRATVSYLREEVNKFKRRPLVVCDIKKMIDDKAIIRLPNGNFFLVDVIGTLKGKLSSGDSVVVEQRSLTVIDKLNEKDKNFGVEDFVIIEKPKIKWDEIGGLKDQIRDLHEVIELPLKNPELFREVGIIPPKGVLLYGPSGTGKTLLAKAIAASTNATFIEFVASELNQKFIGDGAKLVKEIFQLAREKAPSIIFIDELDAIAAQRIDIGTSGEREVQRTFMQLLAEIDGFNNLENVKILGATNRVDILDEAVLRPGRFDRLIEVDMPNLEERREIFKVHTKNMNKEKIDFDLLAEKAGELSGAEIHAICTEAGYFAIRDNRKKVSQADFILAIEKIRNFEEEDLKMFG
ncbi:MAG: AAA family ATPase [Candidatus Nanoarchaeia archaeon]|nr:AAA family ATPase [Candidatus Nanoarchaeia archaeon]